MPGYSCSTLSVKTLVKISDVVVGRSTGSSSVGDADCNAVETTEGRTVDRTVATEEANTVVNALPFSMTSAVLSPRETAEDDGKNRVHQKAIRSPRLTTRCCTIKSTTRRKKTSAAMMSRRSNQSDFSKAVMRCFEVCISPSSTSWVEEADFSDAVEASRQKLSVILNLQRTELRTE